MFHTNSNNILLISWRSVSVLIAEEIGVSEKTMLQQFIGKLSEKTTDLSKLNDKLDRINTALLVRVDVSWTTMQSWVSRTFYLYFATL